MAWVSRNRINRPAKFLSFIIVLDDKTVIYVGFCWLRFKSVLRLPYRLARSPMVTTINSNQDSNDSNVEASLLSDKLRLVLNSTRHPTGTYGDMLKYVHEKPACYNICS